MKTLDTVGEILQFSLTFSQQTFSDAPLRNDITDWLAHVLKCRRADLYLQGERTLTEGEKAQFDCGLEKLQQGCPFAYLTGFVSFFGCEIRVDPRVLICRNETEILVEHIVKRRPHGTVWDVCTGSGCIGIALKKHCPHLRVLLSDLSADALALARENAKRNHVTVETLQGDLLEPFYGQKADVVVCNPPYLSRKEYEDAPISVRGFEPQMALMGGERGIEFYERLAVDLPRCIHAGGNVFLEMGEKQGFLINKIFSSPIWCKKEFILDWSGKERFFFLEKQ